MPFSESEKLGCAAACDDAAADAADMTPASATAMNTADIAFALSSQDATLL